MTDSMTKPKNSRLPETKYRIRNDVRISEEAHYIIRCALGREPSVVTVARLIFFATVAGDAWILDPKSKSALCLAENGEIASGEIEENEVGFEIGWDAQYALDNGVFTVTTVSGEVKTFDSAQVSEIKANEARLLK